jgi:hypothetical protein
MEEPVLMEGDGPLNGLSNLAVDIVLFLQWSLSLHHTFRKRKGRA